MTPPGNLHSRLWGASAALAITGFCLSSFSTLPLRAQQDAAAQQGNKDTTFSTDVNVVNIFATVRDKQNKIVNTMAKDDFTLSEDGHPQIHSLFLAGIGSAANAGSAHRYQHESAAHGRQTRKKMPVTDFSTRCCARKRI